ncbi:unnamed protein product [Cochlearia groenlandica]
MASSSSSSQTNSDFNSFYSFANASSSSSSSSTKKPDSSLVFDDLIFNDMFSGSSNSQIKPSASDFDYDAMFKSSKPASSSSSSSSSMPVYDKPVYDDEDVYESIPELNDDLFSSLNNNNNKDKLEPERDDDDDYEKNKKKGSSVFDDLIPGFGRPVSPPIQRTTSETSQSPKPSYQTAKTSFSSVEDPFVVLEESASTLKEPSSSGRFIDPLEEIGKIKPDHSSVRGGGFVDVDLLESLGKAHPDMNSRDKRHLRPGSVSGSQSPVDSSRSYHPKKVSFDEFSELHNTSSKTASPVYENPPRYKENVTENNKSLNSDGSFESSDDVWLTISEIPLLTQPTSAPPPSRPPPPKPTRPVKKKPQKVSEPSSSTSTDHLHVPTSARPSANSPTAFQTDELDGFSMGRNQSDANGYPEPPPSCEDDDFFSSTAVSSAAAMKDAMDKAEAKFRHAKERREKENLKASRSREGDQTENHYDSRERELREKQASLDREREKAQEREREEREREKKRIEKEKERLLARQAVERATREARERAATEAHAKVQRAAVGKATDARERAERAAVQRANAEARERAAAGAKEKAEKAAAEARDVRAKDERAAVERAAAEARGRTAAQAKAKQQENNNDLDSFFNSVSRPSSAPRQRTNPPPDPFQDSWNKGGSFESSKASSRVSSENLRKASSATNIVDDLSSIFGASSTQSGGFQDVEGETEDRRRARLERHQRTQERAAKALAEKNERDLHVQREQAERNRIGVTLDVEIKRWGAGKEGNLRALLSTLQYVLWPECGWQTVSLTDLITAASVKKFYRKATLCIHPDKVQQKGANLQQKYIAEKVFDLVKEAWNKFNSEELF